MKEKTCSLCKDTKSISDFSKKGSTFQSRCKTCCAIYAHKHYESRKPYYREKAKFAKQRRRTKYIELLKSLECEICKENHPACLDFDHKNPSEKIGNISEMVWKHGWSALMKEIEKCRVLCSNCHRKETAKQFDWYK